MRFLLEVKKKDLDSMRKFLRDRNENISDDAEVLKQAFMIENNWGDWKDFRSKVVVKRAHSPL